MEITDPITQKNVKEQVLFYFGDSNLTRDKFLLQKIQEAKEQNGMVDIKLILSFNRMMKLLNIREESKSTIPDSLASSVAALLSECDALQVDKEKLTVGRKEPLQDIQVAQREVDERSLYVSPFAFDVSLEDIQQFFSIHGAVRAVIMRRSRNKQKTFKGCVFVEFDSKELANKILSMKLTYEGALLHMEKKTEFLKRVAKDGEIDEASGMPSSQVTDDNKNDQPSDEMALPQFVPGCLVRIKFNEELNNDVSFIMIRDSLGGHNAGVVRVDLNKDKREAIARFESPEKLTAALSSIEPISQIPAQEKEVKEEQAGDQEVKQEGDQCNNTQNNQECTSGNTKSAMMAGLKCTIETLTGADEEQEWKFIQWKRDVFKKRAGASNSRNDNKRGKFKRR